MRDADLLLHDILEASEDIVVFTPGMSFGEFVNDDKTRAAVLDKFAVMGEATKMLPDQVREQYPAIPWRSIAGLRDRVIHRYIGVDYELLGDDRIQTFFCDHILPEIIDNREP